MKAYNETNNNSTLFRNPEDGFGLQLTSNLRLLIFEKLPQNFCIDFVPQSLESGRIYIVPDKHFHFLSRVEKCSFYCIDIDEKKLSLSEKKMLYAIKYRQQKSVHAVIPEIEMLSFLKENYRGEKSNTLQFNQIKEMFFESSHSIMQPLSCAAFKHLHWTESFMAQINNMDLQLDECVIDNLILKLKCSERTLQRACISTLGICARSVIKYHILLRATHLLCQQNMPITTISKTLGFSNLSAFDKFVKRLANTTPKDLQHKLLLLGM